MWFFTCEICGTCVLHMGNIWFWPNFMLNTCEFPFCETHVKPMRSHVIFMATPMWNPCYLHMGNMCFWPMITCGIHVEHMGNSCGFSVRGRTKETMQFLGNILPLLLTLRFLQFFPVKRVFLEFFLSRCEGLRSEDVVMLLCKALWDTLFVKMGYTNKIALPCLSYGGDCCWDQFLLHPCLYCSWVA